VDLALVCFDRECKGVSNIADVSNIRFDRTCDRYHATLRRIAAHIAFGSSGLYEQSENAGNFARVRSRAECSQH
jgi:hypothetical protein